MHRARCESKYSYCPGTVGACGRVDNDDLHACPAARSVRSPQPARPVVTIRNVAAKRAGEQGKGERGKTREGGGGEWIMGNSSRWCVSRPRRGRQGHWSRPNRVRSRANSLPTPKEFRHLAQG